MRVIGFFIAVVCLGAGCDGVFGLQEIRGDDDHADAPMQADACVRVGNDEDLDSIDDGCDPCPFDSNNAIDDDHDGIAAACDPDPTKPNQVLLFTGFGPGSEAQFELHAATISGGALRTMIPIVDNAFLFWGQAVDNVYVTASVRITGFDDTANYNQIGFVFDAGPFNADTDGTYCALIKQKAATSPNYVQAYSSTAGTADVVLGQTTPASFGLETLNGDTMRAQFNRNLTPQISCTFSRAGAQPATTTGNRVALPPPGRFGLLIDDVTAEIRYLFIVAKS